MYDTSRVVNGDRLTRLHVIEHRHVYQQGTDRGHL